MPTLWRMQPPGSTNALTYAVRSFYGVNNLAQTPTDYDGVNEACDWTRRVAAAVGAEHTTSGYHNSKTIPVAVLRLAYDGTNYTAGQLCYNAGTTGAGVVSSVVKVTGNNGTFEVTLAAALPSSNLQILGLGGHRYSVALAEVTSTTVFKLVRFEPIYTADLVQWWNFVPSHGNTDIAIFART